MKIETVDNLIRNQLHSKANNITSLLSEKSEMVKVRLEEIKTDSKTIHSIELVIVENLNEDDYGPVLNICTMTTEFGSIEIVFEVLKSFGPILKEFKLLIDELNDQNMEIIKKETDNFCVSLVDVFKTQYM